MTTIGDPAGSAPARVWFALAVAASVFAPAAVFQASAQAEGRYALVVGVEKYNPRFLVPLDHAEDDMERVGKALERLGFNVVAMTSAAEIPERRPVTAADILAEVDRRLKSRDPADTIVLAFSGHGVQLKRDGEGGDRETWFCPERARLDEPATLLPLSQVVARLKACPAKQKLLLVDACRVEVEPKEIRDKSGVPAIELDAAAPFRRQLPEGMAALFSCGPHQKSFELPDTGGVFTHYVVEYLEGRADPARYRRGEATVQELAAYVARETTDHVDQRLREDQVPELVLPGGRLTDWPLGRLADLASVDRKPAMERSLPAVPPVKKPPGGLKPGEVIENSLGMKLVVIPAGEFQMGSDATKEQLKARGMAFFDYRQFDTSDERPIHRVRITKPFLMGQTEVTLGQFMSFYNDVYMGKLDCETDGKGGWGYTGGKPEFAQQPRFSPWSWGHPDIDIRTEAGKSRAFRYPVMNVSWTDSMAFCEWLSKKEGKQYRLPTEAEWEYACRAGTTSQFWNGDDSEGLVAIENFADGTAKQKFPWWKGAVANADGHAFTSPVGAYPRPNPFGLYDMHGNVSEWCSDWYDENYYATFASTPAVDPQGPLSASSFRVVRGGSWHYDAASCRSAYRGNVPPSRRGGVGFRVVCEVD